MQSLLAPSPRDAEDRRMTQTTIFGQLSSLCVALAFILAEPLAATEQTAPRFEVTNIGTGDTLAIRIDALPEIGPTAGEYLSTEYSVNGGSPVAIARDWHEDRRVIFLFNLPHGKPAEVRLRGRFFVRGKIVEGPWSAPQIATPEAVARAAEALKAFASEDWDIETDPDRANALRVRLNSLPAAGGVAIHSVSLRRSPRQALAELSPEIGVWQSVPLDPAEILPGQIEGYSIRAMTDFRPSPSAPWSAPKLAASGWPISAQPETPAAPLPWSWFLRPSGISGEAVVEIAEPVLARGSPITGFDARWARADVLFAPIDGWGDWQALPGKPAPDGRMVLTLKGLPDDQPVVVEIRAVNALGAGLPAVRKQVATRAFGLPTRVTFGALNAEGTGAIRIPRGVRLESASAGKSSDWRVIPGKGRPWDYLAPAVAGDKLSDAKLAFSDGRAVEVHVAPRTFAAETAADILAFLSLRPEVKSGATLLVGPEWINLGMEDRAFIGAFSGLTASVTLRPREPENGTLLSNWVISEGKAGVSAGHLHVEDMTFFSPMAQNLDAIFNISGNGDFNDITLDRVRVVSDLMPMRLGSSYRFSTQTRAINLTGARDVAVRNSEVAFTVYGVAVGAQNAIATGNRVHHLGADPFNLFFRKGTAEKPTLLHDISIENNTEYDYMGDTSWLHPDGLQMWMIGTGSDPDHSRIERLSYSGNVSFPGREGALARPSVSQYYLMRGVSADGPVLATDDRRFLRVDASKGPVTLTLPPLDHTPAMLRHPGQAMELAIQKIDLSDNPVHVRQAAGDPPAELFGDFKREFDLLRPFQAIVLTAEPDKRRWQVRIPGPALQGFFADPNEVPLPGLVVEGNVLWGTAPNQVLPQNRPQDGVEIRHNTVLPFWPGDTNGDGHFNTPGDGAGPFPLWIRLRAADGTVNVWGNVAQRVEAQPGGNPPTNHEPVIWGNEAFVDRKVAWLEKQFPGLKRAVPDRPDSLIWFPTNREEAIAMARPAPGSEIARLGLGALGASPETDWWDYATNRRNAAALPALRIEALVPSDGAATVATSTSLELTANLPLRPPLGHALGTSEAERRRSVRLIEKQTGTVVQEWNLASTPEAGRFDIAGPRLRFDLATSLKLNTIYRVEINPDTLVDVFGQRLESAGQVLNWEFKTAP